MTSKQSALIGIAAFVVIAGLLALMAGILPGSRSPTDDNLPAVTIGGPFALASTNGAVVTEKTYRDKWQLVYFGYTLCPDACPTALNEIAGALEKLGPLAEKVQPLFITVDPERDTQAIMAAYVTSFDPRIVGLTGTPEQIAVAAKAYRVYYAKAADKNAPDGYLMDHSSVIYVLRPGDGRLVATFTQDTTADQMAERLRQLVAQS